MLFLLASSALALGGARSALALGGALTGGADLDSVRAYIYKSEATWAASCASGHDTEAIDSFLAPDFQVSAGDDVVAL